MLKKEEFQTPLLENQNVYIKCLICRYRAAMPVEISMVGIDQIKNFMKLMG